MTTDPCAGCGRAVGIAGGVANFWTFGGDPATGLALELEDGSEHLLCYGCIEALPDHPQAADVAALGEHE